MNTLPTSIDQVLEQLDSIIQDSVKDNDHLGIFAYVYRRTTAQIKQAIQNQDFEDNDRMERFDIRFASKYLQAYYNFQSGMSVPKSWEIAFRVKSERLTILQHILLGMNAHINYDLGMTAYEISRAKELEDLKTDFMKVNDILNGLINEMQRRLGRVSRLMVIFDWIGGDKDEAIINFSMVKAREQAWDFAEKLAHTEEDLKKTREEEVDKMIARLGQVIKAPPGKLLGFACKFVAFFEVKNISKIIRGLEK